MEKINSEQKNKKNLHKIFKKVFHGQFRDSTIHGLGHIINATHWITRILWLLLFSLSVAYCILTVVQAIIAYKNYTTKITISRVNELPVTYPAITLCNINIINEENQNALNYLNRELKESQCFSSTTGLTFENCFQQVSYYLHLELVVSEYSFNETTFIPYNLKLLFS